ncbi:hypothetical protein BZL41_08880 [Pseudomonas sp. PIC25]|nr:hypothetical protein BZL41_08880 [Pseudomonas sp. PIC25]
MVSEALHEPALPETEKKFSPGRSVTGTPRDCRKDTAAVKEPEYVKNEEPLSVAVTVPESP